MKVIFLIRKLILTILPQCEMTKAKREQRLNGVMDAVTEFRSRKEEV